MGRNRTGPPCSVDCRHSSSGRLAMRSAACPSAGRVTDVGNRRQRPRAKQYWPIRQASNNVFIFVRIILSKVDQIRVWEFDWGNGALAWEQVNRTIATLYSLSHTAKIHAIAWCGSYCFSRRSCTQKYSSRKSLNASCWVTTMDHRVIVPLCAWFRPWDIASGSGHCFVYTSA